MSHFNVAAVASGGCIRGGCIRLVLVPIFIVMAVVTLMSIGSIFGAGVAVHNYFLAFRNNVKPERIKP